MADKNLSDLRKTLFETLEEVRTKKIDLDRAKVVVNVAQTIINTASAEIRAINALGRDVVPGEFFGSVPAGNARLTGKPAELPPSHVVDPLRVRKIVPNDE